MNMTTATLPRSHLNGSIEKIDGASWLIAKELILTHSDSPPDASSTHLSTWSDGDGKFFILRKACSPLPETKPLAQDAALVPRVHAVNDEAAVWRAGDAFIKAHSIEHPHCTREHTTLGFLKEQQPHGFNFPDVLHHFENESTYFLVMSRVSGQTLDDAWPDMDDAMRDYYICKVASICDYLTGWKGDRIAGVDGNQILERYLIRWENKRPSKADDALSPEQLAANCTDMSMDVSRLGFYHCDLGPTNIFVDTAAGSLSIIDWELAGYVPIEWIRTKFRLSPGLDLSHGDDHDRTEWRRRVAQQLEKLGYDDAVDGWWKSRNTS